MNALIDLLAAVKVMPVLTIHTPDEAVAVCRALQAGGINAVEITLRTPAAREAIVTVQAELPDFIVGVGTVKSVADMESVASLGVAFAVSPGFTRKLSDCAFATKVPLLPGISTASELMEGMDAGRSFFKFFPAEAAGGIAMLTALAAPFPEVRFCPTGGITSGNFRDYLALPSVVCVGGSWMVAPEIIKRADWAGVERRARDCAGTTPAATAD